MVDNGRINDILNELNNHPKVITSLVISRSGMHMAGQAPEDVQQETFAAMAAILINAAETVTSGLKGEMENVFVELDRKRVIIDNVGKKGVLVVITNTKDNHDSLYVKVKITIKELASML